MARMARPSGSALVLAGATACLASLALPAPPASAADCLGITATVVGRPGIDRVVGTSRNDVIITLGGNDTIQPGLGDDLVCAGDGNDVIVGGADDRIVGAQGDDAIVGDAAGGCSGGGQRDTGTPRCEARSSL
jgi:hypothetical protein